MFNRKKLKNVLQESQQAIDENHSYIDAIKKNMAFIAFTPEGVILEANEHFLAATQYYRDEVVGQHHRMFCDKD